MVRNDKNDPGKMAGSLWLAFQWRNISATWVENGFEGGKLEQEEPC